MKVTNKYNLPAPMVAAIKNEQYVKRGDISVTKMIDSPQISKLFKEHYNEIEEDVIDKVWALFGTSVHSVIERADEGNEDYLSEVPLEMECNDWTLTGTADLYDKKSKTLYDFKVTSAWKAMAKEPDSHWSWEAQLNTYAYMLRLKGYEVEKLRIIAILKDWNKREADRNFETGKYPQKQVAEIALTMYSQEGMEKYINKRIKLHQGVLNGEIEPHCSDRDRWSSKDTFAVMKTGGKRAKKVFDNEKEANDYLKIDGDFVETRKGEPRRCKDYCSVSQWCEQYNSSK